MANNEINVAVESLKSGKNSSVVLRNLNYILSRCETIEDMEYVINCIDTNNVIKSDQIWWIFKSGNPFAYDNGFEIKW